MTTEVDFRLTADLDQARKEVAGFRKEYAELVDQVEKPLRGVNLARDLERGLEATSKQVAQAKARLSDLQRELINTDYPTERLKESFKSAAKELQRLERVEGQQADQLGRLRSELKAAGVDTSRLASEQRRLGAEMNRALSAGRTDVGLQTQTANFQRAIQQAAQARLAAEQQQARNFQQAIQQAAQAKQAEQQRYAAAAQGIRAQTAALQQQANVQRQANMEAARNSLGVDRFRALQAEIQKARQQYELLRSSGKLTARELAVAQQQLTQRIRESKSELQSLAGEQGGGIGSLLSDVGGRLGIGAGAGAAAGVAGAAYLASRYAAAVDPLKEMDAQLRLATESQQEFNKAQADSYRIADLAKAPITDIAGLYAKLVPPLRDVGRTQQDAANVTEAFALGLRLSGSSASTAAGAIQQFSQTMGQGVLRAEEYNSVVDGNIRLIRAFAEELGVTVGEFRQMVLDGEITSDVISDLSGKVLPKLREEMGSLPETYSAAVTSLSNESQLLIKKFDDLVGVSGKVIEGINGIALAMKRVRGGEFSDFFREDKTTVAGINNEISVLLSRVRDLQAARTRLNKNDPNDTALFKFRFNTKEDFDRQIAELESYIQELLQKRQEMVDKEAEQDQQRKTQFDMHAAEMKALRMRAAEDAKSILEQQLKDTKRVLAEQVKAESKAASDLEKAKKAQLDTQKRYKEALAGLSAGSGGEPSFSQASALKVAARQSLQAGNVEEAKKQAQAALVIIQELAKAGQNTYGFAGFIKELEAIESSADQRKVEDAEGALQKAKQQALETRAVIDELKKQIKDMKLTVELSPEDEQKLLGQLADLAKKAAILLTIPATVVMPKAGEADADGYVFVPPNPPAPKFAGGGILRGPGTGTSDSMLAWLSNGEGILTARAVQHYGAGLVHQINRLQLPRFATGGIAERGFSLSAIPPLAPELQAQLDGHNFPDLGYVALDLGGSQPIDIYTSPAGANELKLAARKFGRTRPR